MNIQQVMVEANFYCIFLIYYSRTQIKKHLVYKLVRHTVLFDYG